MSNRMLIAVKSGFLVDHGELVEITRGKDRIAPEVLERPGYAKYFDPDVGLRGTDADRCEVRTTFPDGRVIADHRF